MKPGQTSSVVAESDVRLPLVNGNSMVEDCQLLVEHWPSSLSNKNVTKN